MKWFVLASFFMMLNCQSPTESNLPLNENEWFPLAVGNTWTLRDTTFQSTEIIKVDSTKQEEGVSYFHVTGLPLRLFRAEKERILAYESTDSQEIVFLDVTRSTLNTHYGQSDVVVTLEDEYDSLIVNDRVYRQIRKYRFHPAQIIDAVQILYLCKGIGVIRHEVYGDVVYNYELSEYELK